MHTIYDDLQFVTAVELTPCYEFNKFSDPFYRQSHNLWLIILDQQTSLLATIWEAKVRIVTGIFHHMRSLDVRRIRQIYGVV